MVHGFKNHVKFWLFFLCLHVFIVSLKMCSKQEAMLSSLVVCPDNFSPPFSILKRDKKCVLGFDAAVRLFYLITALPPVKSEDSISIWKGKLYKCGRCAFFFFYSPFRRPCVGLCGWQPSMVQRAANFYIIFTLVGVVSSNSCPVLPLL